MGKMTFMRNNTVHPYLMRKMKAFNIALDFTSLWFSSIGSDQYHQCGTWRPP